MKPPFVDGIPRLLPEARISSIGTPDVTRAKDGSASVCSVPCEPPVSRVSYHHILSPFAFARFAASIPAVARVSRSSQEGTIMRLDEFLTNHHVPFTKLAHRPAYTANRVAQALHVPGRGVAKTVLIRTGHGHVLAVLPATHQVNLDEMRQALHEDRVEMASEDEMDALFPDCERGAMPPFGSLYHLPT